MPKSKTPVWLRESFRDGVDFRENENGIAAGYLGCQLGQLDPLERLCSGRLERFHWISRQRIRNALAPLFFEAPVEGGYEVIDAFTATELIQLAEWDSRNGGIGCEGHHRRFDGHMGPKLYVSIFKTPAHFDEFVEDWGLEIEAERKFVMEVGHEMERV